MSTGDVEKELEAKGLRPDTHEELLAFGATYPEFQRQFPIVALGSFAKIDGDRCVLYLSLSGSERSLDLRWLGVDWDGDYRFLAVAK